MKNVNSNFVELVKYINKFDISNIHIENKISTIQILKHCHSIKNDYIPIFSSKNIDNLINIYINNKRDILISNICHNNNTLKILDIKNKRLRHSGKKNSYENRNN